MYFLFAQAFNVVKKLFNVKSTQNYTTLFVKNFIYHVSNKHFLYKYLNIGFYIF